MFLEEKKYSKNTPAYFDASDLQSCKLSVPGRRRRTRFRSCASATDQPVHPRSSCRKPVCALKIYEKMPSVLLPYFLIVSS
jgi:hypothetical protein